MARLTLEQLRELAKARGIEYEELSSPKENLVRSRLSRVFPISQQAAFDAFSDPVSHVGLFSILKGATPPIRSGIEKLLGANQFLAFEHVEESNLPPRLMLVKYTLDRPTRILKEGVTDPLSADGGVVIMDRKKALVEMRFDAVGAQETRITCESSFEVETGKVFTRAFIDQVWLNFYERMMMANGQITEDEMLT